MSCLADNPKILIRGWFGNNNVGDDAILEAMFDSIRLEFPSAEIVLVSHDPAAIAEKYYVKAVSDNIRRSFFLYVKELLTTDVFVLGGGGLFPRDSPRSVIDLILLLLMARVLGVKESIIYSIGVDPIRQKLTKLLLSFCFNYCVSIISVRDNESMLVLTSAGVTKPTFVFLDPALLLPRDDVGAATLCRLAGISSDTPYMVVALGKPFDLVQQPSDRDRYGRFLDGCIGTIDRFMEEHSELHVVLVPFSYPGDLEISQEILKHLNHKKRAHVLNVMNHPRVAKSIIGRSVIVLGMRFHSVVFSVSTSTPIVAISYGPKIDSLMSMCDVSQYSERLGISRTAFFKEERDVDFGSLYNKLESAYEKRNEIRVQLENSFGAMCEEVQSIGKLLKDI